MAPAGTLAHCKVYALGTRVSNSGQHNRSDHLFFLHVIMRVRSVVCFRKNKEKGDDN